MGSRAEFRILAGSAAFPVCEAQTHAADRALCEDLGKQGLGLGTCLYCIWMLTDIKTSCVDLERQAHPWKRHLAW